MNLKNKSWKSTGLGIGGLLLAIGTALTAMSDDSNLTNVDWAAFITVCIPNFALLFVRDNTKTSEQVGAK